MDELRLRRKIWWIRYNRNGRRFEESTRSKKKTEAERVLKLREGAVARGEPITAAMARVTVDQAFTRVEEDYALKGQRSLFDTKRQIKKHLLPFFTGRRPLAESHDRGHCSVPGSPKAAGSYTSHDQPGGGDSAPCVHAAAEGGHCVRHPGNRALA